MRVEAVQQAIAWTIPSDNMPESPIRLPDLRQGRKAVIPAPTNAGPFTTAQKS
jgi:hypothetical protein